MLLVRISLMIEGNEGVTWDQWVAPGRAAEDAGLGRLLCVPAAVSVPPKEVVRIVWA